MNTWYLVLILYNGGIDHIPQASLEQCKKNALIFKDAVSHTACICKWCQIITAHAVFRACL